MKTLGIDLSHWEGAIDWQLAAPWVGFAYYKCTEGTRWIDKQFENNRKGCDQAGLPHAPYHYYHSLLDPVQQADFFITTAGLNYKRYIVDMEKPDHDPHIVAHLRSFLERCHALSGIKPAIYTSAGYWNQFVRPNPGWASQYDLIVANFTVKHEPAIPTGWEEYRIWQFSDYFFIPGCNTACDGDWFNGPIQECRSWFGNYQPSKPILPETGMQLRSHFEGLHIRKEPRLNASEVGHLRKGELVQVLELGGCDAWVRHARGWSAIEIAGYRYMEVVS
jgi:lysozyme